MKTGRRIGLVLSSRPGYSETFFRNKIQGLQKNGIEVVLFTIEQHGDFKSVLNCKVIQAPSFKGSKIKSVLTGVWVLLKANVLTPRMCYKHFRLDRLDGFSFKNCMKRLIQNAFLFDDKLDWLHFGFGMLAVERENVAQAIGANMAVSFRGFDLYLSPLKHPNCYDLLFKKAVRYHVLSKKMKKKLTTFNIPETKIHLISPAIDISLFEYLKRLETTLLPLKILCVSRLHWVKGLHYLLEALFILKKEKINFSLTVIGDGEEKERLIFAANQYGILNNINFTGKLPQAEVRQYLKVSNLYVQYSIQEGFCNAVLEAQAMGLLTIVSDAGGLSENVLHNQTGWVVPKRHPNLLSEQIKAVTKLSFKERSRISKNAMNRVQNDFNLEQQLHLFLKFYDK